MDNTMSGNGIRREYVTNDGNRFRTRLDALRHVRMQRYYHIMNRRNSELERLNREQNQILREKLQLIFNNDDIINTIIENKVNLKQILRRIKYFRV